MTIAKAVPGFQGLFWTSGTAETPGRQCRPVCGFLDARQNASVYLVSGAHLGNFR
jgi:hypothetical protein